jgi:hypothetical protein
MTDPDADLADDTASDRDMETVRDAQGAHGGSMAPSIVDETGRPVTEPPPATAPE